MKIYVVLIWNADTFAEGDTYLLTDKQGQPLTYTYKRAAKVDGKREADTKNYEDSDDAWAYRVVELNCMGGY